jgi:hypothetical protein
VGFHSRAMTSPRCMARKNDCGLAAGESREAVMGAFRRHESNRRLGKIAVSI